MYGVGLIVNVRTHVWVPMYLLQGFHITSTVFWQGIYHPCVPKMGSLSGTTWRTLHWWKEEASGELPCWFVSCKFFFTLCLRYTHLCVYYVYSTGHLGQRQKCAFLLPDTNMFITRNKCVFLCRQMYSSPETSVFITMGKHVFSKKEYLPRMYIRISYAHVY